MGISTESVLRGVLVLLPWVISILAVYLATNRANPERPMLTKRNSIVLIVLGILMFMAGIALANVGIVEGEIPESKVMGVEYKFIGLLLVLYAQAGKHYKLVKLKS